MVSTLPRVFVKIGKTDWLGSFWLRTPSIYVQTKSYLQQLVSWVLVSADSHLTLFDSFGFVYLYNILAISCLVLALV